jgi:putative two-component system response regulator
MPEATEARTHRILVVDDNLNVSDLLKLVLVREGYEVRTASNGLEALACVPEFRPHLLLLDLTMPHLCGDEVCRRLKKDPATQLTQIIIVTANADMQNRVDAWEYGADEFLTKPFHLIEVTTRCRSLLRTRQLLEERESAETVVFALARAVEAKSPYTQGHSERVTAYAQGLASALGIPEDQRELLRKGSLLHDIGKLSIPDAILDKPGQLTGEEFEIVKSHTVQGAHIVEPLVSLRNTVPLIRSHHERLDGKGYPDGLAGDAIPLLVRILSVSDVYDSLASQRPYRPALPLDQCLAILRENALDGGLDRELVALFIEMMSGCGGDLMLRSNVVNAAPREGPAGGSWPNHLRPAHPH